jgi:hypothetical protein
MKRISSIVLTASFFATVTVSAPALSVTDIQQMDNGATSNSSEMEGFSFVAFYPF